MGRLGFNLVREKEASKVNVEAGLPNVADQQQNVSNENVEIGELILAIEERNRKIENLNLLSKVLAIIVFVMSVYIIIEQVQMFDAEKAETNQAQKMVMDYQSTMEALKETYEARVQREVNQLRHNCSAIEASRSQLESELKIQQALVSTLTQRHNEELERLKEGVTNLCQETENELKAEMRRLGAERAELERKLDEASRQIERHAVGNLRQAKTSPEPTTTTTTTSTTTTPVPTTTQAPARGLFDTDRFRKFNDLMKDIESGAAIFDLRGFMKKTDDILLSFKK